MVSLIKKYNEKRYQSYKNLCFSDIVLKIISVQTVPRRTKFTFFFNIIGLPERRKVFINN